MLALVIQMGGGLFLVPVGAALPPFGGGIPEGVDPGYGIPTFPHVGQGLPVFPGRPGNDLPNFPGRPGNELPQLPPDAAHPGHELPLPPQISNGLPIYPGRPDHDLPPAGVVWPPLPPSVPSGKALALVAISGVGYRWTVIDTSLTAGMPLPPTAKPK